MYLQALNLKVGAAVSGQDGQSETSAYSCASSNVLRR
jgi:hypothetical protein